MNGTRYLTDDTLARVPQEIRELALHDATVNAMLSSVAHGASYQLALECCVVSLARRHAAAMERLIEQARYAPPRPIIFCSCQRYAP